jgi:diguanylate cyclase (GGDEF)-like protein
MAAGSFIDLRNEEMHSRHLAISTGLEKIVRFNQELNAMLLVSVLERNTLRSSTYQTVYDKLELSVTSVEELTRQLELADDISALGFERRELRQVELRALELMEADQWDEARSLLFDEGYVLARKIYEINSETAISALNGELMKTAATFGQARNISLVVRAAALVLLLWAGLMFSSRLRRELAEQERLRNQISAANILLEDKVRDRTVELEEANSKLAALSITDSLTGLANRRRFDEVIHTEWQRARRQNIPLAVAMIDVDQFKAYNDYFGHQAGDECLRRIAVVLRNCVQRSGDLLARYGGEEFVVVLPGIGSSEAGGVAENIRKAIQAEALEHTSISESGVVTVSIGVAAKKPSSDDKTGELLREADAALYTAKRAGRNIVIIFPDKTVGSLQDRGGG